MNAPILASIFIHRERTRRERSFPSEKQLIKEEGPDNKQNRPRISVREPCFRHPTPSISTPRQTTTSYSNGKRLGLANKSRLKEEIH